ncbi:extracellular matrix protein 1-like [Lampris incognitus]|uniref:extracellular matrix protein 1-like n=1 Tax=Lampris incognitus TaxID=2546036 RepID=UPI0024B4B4FD|nr:extracellular matrix protein 1-like [Lampris incognitus]
MIWTGGITGLWMLALLALDGANYGETRPNSLNEPDVPFPPARPTAENLAAICQHGQGRPRYPPRYFPRTGVSHFVRRGDAVNRLESWYGACCGEQTAQENSAVLCCAQQAWKQALSQFCVEELSTKTVAYECCDERGEARWTCFNSELPNPMYNPTPGYTAPAVLEELGFAFKPSAC